jgi:repressor LexA
MAEVTDRTMLVYRAIVNHTREHGYTPSIREVCQRVGMTSTSSVHTHVDRLVELGWLERVGPGRRLKLGRK